MKSKTRKLILIMATLPFASGCVRSLPAISHAHIGHALSAWHDTPDKMGLFVVAESEADNARKELEMAKSTVDTTAAMTEHLQNVVHSLNPQIQKQGTGAGYGAIAAIQAVMQHIDFAAKSRDASENIVSSEKTLTPHANATVDKFLLALAQARLATAVDSSQTAHQLPVLEDFLEQAIDGVDIDRDGVIGNLPDESGLKQLGKLLSDMAANEVDPPYVPIARRYLLGLIPLPGGGWAYDL